MFVLLLLCQIKTPISCHVYLISLSNQKTLKFGELNKKEKIVEFIIRLASPPSGMHVGISRMFLSPDAREKKWSDVVITAERLCGFYDGGGSQNFASPMDSANAPRTAHDSTKLTGVYDPAVSLIPRSSITSHAKDLFIKGPLSDQPTIYLRSLYW